MGRRGLHNEGAEMLRERLKGKAEMDFATARACSRFSAHFAGAAESLPPPRLGKKSHISQPARGTKR